MNHLFLEKFFLVSRTVAIRKEICGIQQHSGETLHEYWERFNKLCVMCLYHQISEQLLFLLMRDRNKVDGASGGALMDKTPATARHLISNMASNMQWFGIRGGASTSRVIGKLADGANISCEAARCQAASTKHMTCAPLCRRQSLKVLNALEHLEVDTNIEGRHIRTGPESESRETYNNEIWTSREHVKFESEQLSTARSKILGAIIPSTTATTSATTRKFFRNGRLDETNGSNQHTIPRKSNCHNS
ncbi:hypothetical protein CR513_12061, partial [Mucuna pruriens]